MESKNGPSKIMPEQSQRESSGTLSEQERERLGAFFGLLIQIDRRLKKQAGVKREK
jgi:hypothetical protein